MYLSLITYAIEFLQGEVSEASDLEDLSFNEGVFHVFIAHHGKGNFDQKLFADYLSNFIREGGFERDILTDRMPHLLKDLDAMLEQAITEKE